MAPRNLNVAGTNGASSLAPDKTIRLRRASSPRAVVVGDLDDHGHHDPSYGALLTAVATRPTRRDVAAIDHRRRTTSSPTSIGTNIPYKKGLSSPISAARVRRTRSVRTSTATTSIFKLDISRTSRPRQRAARDRSHAKDLGSSSDLGPTWNTAS